MLGYCIGKTVKTHWKDDSGARLQWMGISDSQTWANKFRNKTMGIGSKQCTRNILSLTPKWCVSFLSWYRQYWCHQLLFHPCNTARLKLSKNRQQMSVQPSRPTKRIHSWEGVKHPSSFFPTLQLSELTFSDKTWRLLPASPNGFSPKWGWPDDQTSEHRFELTSHDAGCFSVS